VHATAGGTGLDLIPYAMQDRDFWVIADSPFSYSAEK